MIRYGLISGALVLAADQASKAWVLYGLRLPEIGQWPLLPFFSLTYVENRGVTFGLLHQSGPAGAWLLAAVALAVVAGLGVWLRRAETVRAALALGAVGGGAIGNVIDRLRFGFVVDFLHAHAFGWSWYVFNVADAAIVCGVAVLGLTNTRSRLRATSPGTKTPA